MKEIALLGEGMIELNGKIFGEMQQTHGGDTLNTAVYLARANNFILNSSIKISYVTALGNDPISRGMIERWNDEGIDTQLTLIDKGRKPGLYMVRLDRNGEREFLYWRGESAARYMFQHPEFQEVTHKLSHVDFFYFSGVSLAVLPGSDRDRLIDLVRNLKKEGVCVIFDSNYRPSLWEQQAASNEEVKLAYTDVYSQTDIALVTFDDEQLLWQDGSPQKTFERIKKLGVGSVIVKMGRLGCLMESLKGKLEVISARKVARVTDTTAAGDSFNGGFLSAYLEGLNVQDACKRGNLFAGIVIQHPGAIVPRHDFEHHYYSENK